MAKKKKKMLEKTEQTWKSQPEFIVMLGLFEHFLKTDIISFILKVGCMPKHLDNINRNEKSKNQKKLCK